MMEAVYTSETLVNVNETVALYPRRLSSLLNFVADYILQ
jgi:hypothetical protein